jgi:hypothetical protein
MAGGVGVRRARRPTLGLVPGVLAGLGPDDPALATASCHHLPVIIAAVRAAGLEFDTLCDPRNDHLIPGGAPVGAPARD